MMIELHGAGFHNKGAQLMLLTVIRELSRRLPGARFCVEPGCDRSYEDRASYGLYNLIPDRDGHSLLQRSARAVARVAAKGLGRSKLANYGLTRRDDCAAMIDISGYAFGDGWPAEACNRFYRRASVYARSGRPVIMLPQMFGPFRKPDVRAAFGRVASTASLIYARDQVSLEAVHNVTGPDPRLQMAPDITIFTPAEPQAQPPVAQDPYVCLVPNIRMLDQGDADWGASYLDLLVAAGTQVVDAGHRVLLLVHDAAGKDAGLAEQIAERIGGDRTQLCVEKDPLVAKAIIANSLFLVGSRFHSIVGALSTAVPAIILGWAHKYDALAADFGVEELVQQPPDPSEHLRRRIERLLDTRERSQLTDQLSQAKQAMASANEAMWQAVVETVNYKAETWPSEQANQPKEVA
ncbi:MAG: polysaccharide pyruvyl transferase family protein [Phycisphaerae bacterium]